MELSLFPFVCGLLVGVCVGIFLIGLAAAASSDYREGQR